MNTTTTQNETAANGQNARNVTVTVKQSSAWTASTREEAIAALWTIAALVAFSSGHNVIGWVLTAKAALDILCALFLAIDETLGIRR